MIDVDGRAAMDPLVVPVIVDADHVQRGLGSADLRPDAARDQIEGLELGVVPAMRLEQRAAGPIGMLDRDQRLGGDEARPRVDGHQLRAGGQIAAGQLDLQLEPAAPGERVQIARIPAGPGQEADLVHRAPEGDGIRHLAMVPTGGAGQPGKAVDEGRGPDVQIVRPAVMHHVPDHLRAGVTRRLKHRGPGSQVQRAARVDRRPAQGVAAGADAQALQLQVILGGMGVVTDGRDDIQPPPVAPPMGRGFPSPLDHAGEQRGRRRRGLFGQDGVDQRLPLRHHDRGGIGCAHMGLQRRSQAVPQVRIVDQPTHGGGHRPGILVRHEQAADAVADLLQGAVVGGGDDGQARGPGLGDDMGHALAPAEPAEDIHRRQQVGDVRPVPGKDHAVAKGCRQRLQLQRVFRHEGVRPADDDEPRLRMAGGDAHRGGQEILDPLLAVQAADPSDQHLVVGDAKRRADGRPACRIELGQIDHRRDLDRMVGPVGHASRRRRADAVADAHIARGQVLGPGQRLADQPAMFDQRRAQGQTLHCGIDVGDVLTADHHVGPADLAAQIVDGVVEPKRIGRRVDMDAKRAQLVGRLVGHPLLAKAGDDVDPVPVAGQGAGQQAQFRLLSADDQPGQDEQDADLAGVRVRDGQVLGRLNAPGLVQIVVHRIAPWRDQVAKTTWRKSNRSVARRSRNRGASSKGTTWVIRC